MAFVTKVAMDTNILLAINELKIDVFKDIRESLGKVEFIVPKQVLKELETIGKKSKKDRQNVLIAKKLIKKNKVKQVMIQAKNADNALLKLGKKAIIATNDKELKKAIIEKKGHIIFIKQKKMIEVC